MTVPTPPLGDVRPAMDLTCARLFGDDYCGKPATWHVFWTVETDNSVCCDDHMTEAEGLWAWYDRHPVTSICTMPNARVVWSWNEEPGRCIWHVDDEELVAAANAPAPVEVAASARLLPVTEVAAK